MHLGPMLQRGGSWQTSGAKTQGPGSHDPASWQSRRAKEPPPGSQGAVIFYLVAARKQPPGTQAAPRTTSLRNMLFFGFFFRQISTMQLHKRFGGKIYCIIGTNSIFIPPKLMHMITYHMANQTIETSIPFSFRSILPNHHSLSDGILCFL